MQKSGIVMSSGIVFGGQK